MIMVPLQDVLRPWVSRCSTQVSANPNLDLTEPTPPASKPNRPQTPAGHRTIPVSSLKSLDFMKSTTLYIAAALAALSAVALGAFGAHGLKNQLNDTDMAIYRTAVEYHMWHALGLGFIGLLAERYPGSSCLTWAGGLMLAGIAIFSGSLYLLSISGLRWLGMITPIGGLSFMAAWALTAWGVHAATRSRASR